jgi:microcystin-dependent protein
LYGVLPVGWFLECSTEGTSGSGDLTIATPTEGNTVTDGTVEWTIKKMGSGNGDGFAVGDIIMIAGNNTIRDGWLECDGRAVSRTMFPDLFDAIGTTYGAGDGSTTFNLPNYSDGKFPEGSSVAGTVKSAGLPNIEGELGYPRNAPRLKTGAFSQSAYSPSILASAQGSATDIQNAWIKFDASLSNSIYGASNTVQPYSCTVRYVIKAYDGVTPTPAEADISEILTELTGKADRRLSNLDTANLACHVVVDSYYDATTGDWWREYDDGWLEQGGSLSLPDLWTITFIKPFINDKYCMQGEEISGDSTANMGIQTRTSTYASGNHNGSTSVPYNWVAFGQGAQS